MTKSEFVEQVIIAGRREHQSRKTWQAYAGWARRYAEWLHTQKALHIAGSGSDDLWKIRLVSNPHFADLWIRAA